MTQRSREFWTGESEYQNLAKRYERGIEVVSPEAYRNCRCGFRYCSYDGTTVTYYEYRGESI